MASITSNLQQFLLSLLYSPLTLAAYIQTLISKPQPQPTLQIKPVSSCRYRLDTSTSATLLLPDSRTLSYAEHGNPTGHAVFNLHGLPGARLEGSFLEPAALKHNLRIITIDRPGYGQSSPHPTRTILSHAHDIAHLAKHLNLTSYGVLGTSGGGPYALACALVLPPTDLKVVAITCGLGSPDMGLHGMRWQHKFGFSIGWRYLPSLTRWYFSREPAAQLHLSDDERLRLTLQQAEANKSSLDPKDAAFFGDVDMMRVFLANARETYAQGMDGMLLDGKLLASDFGFDIRDIRKDLPVQLWYGKRDNFVPANHGTRIQERIGGNASLRVEDEIHASIFVNWHDERLRMMAEVLAQGGS